MGTLKGLLLLLLTLTLMVLAVAWWILWFVWMSFVMLFTTWVPLMEAMLHRILHGGLMRVRGIMIRFVSCLRMGVFAP